MKHLIGVIGAGQCSDDIYELAREAGRVIAQKGLGLVCGGLEGVMAGAAKGCKENGGLTIGLIPQDNASYANPYIDVVIPTGIGIMRNLLVVRSARGVLAIDGKFGTLSEIAFALQLGKPLVGLGTWEISEQMTHCESPQEAVEVLLAKMDLASFS